MRQAFLFAILAMVGRSINPNPNAKNQHQPVSLDELCHKWHNVQSRKEALGITQRCLALGLPRLSVVNEDRRLLDFKQRGQTYEAFGDRHRAPKVFGPKDAETDARDKDCKAKQ